MSIAIKPENGERDMIVGLKSLHEAATKAAQNAATEHFDAHGE